MEYSLPAWLGGLAGTVVAVALYVPAIRIVERRLRALVTRSLLREAQALRAQGIRVTLLTPGPEDLAAMGVNLMEPTRRAATLETSLRTSAAAFAASQAQVA